MEPGDGAEVRKCGELAARREVQRRPSHRHRCRSSPPAARTSLDAGGAAPRTAARTFSTDGRNSNHFRAATRPSTRTVNSPRSPSTNSTSTPGSFRKAAARPAARSRIPPQTGHWRIVTFFIAHPPNRRSRQDERADAVPVALPPRCSYARLDEPQVGLPTPAGNSRLRHPAANPRLEPCRADARDAVGIQTAVVQRRAEVAGLRARCRSRVASFFPISPLPPMMTIFTSILLVVALEAYRTGLSAL